MLRVLIRRKSNRPLLLYYIDPGTGREISRSSGTLDKGEAERAAALWEQELIGYRGKSEDGWQLFRDRFRDEHLQSLAPSTVSSFGTALNHYQRLMAPGTMGDITAATVSQFQAKLLGENRPVTSVRNYMTHLRAALRWAKSVGLMREAPSMRLPRIITRVFMRGRPVTTKELKRIMRVCNSRELRRMMRLLWLSGLRLGEAMRLSWDSPPIVVDMDGQPNPQILYFAEGHKARRDDAVPMTPELHAWLSRTRNRTGLVAPLWTKHQRTVSECISEMARLAGVFVSDSKPAGAHDLRRSFATRMARRVMPMTLQKLMRHADLTTTLRYYVGLSSADAGRELWSSKQPKAARD